MKRLITRLRDRWWWARLRFQTVMLPDGRPARVTWQRTWRGPRLHGVEVWTLPTPPDCDGVYGYTVWRAR